MPKGELNAAYAATKRWRQANPDKRKAAKLRHYAKGNVNTSAAMTRWTPEQVRQIMAAERPTDRTLAARFGRTVQAIQLKRYHERRRLDGTGRTGVKS